jgi:Protein of unknown function (DUF2855)
MSLDFLVNKKNLKEHRTLSVAPADQVQLKDDEALLSIHHFALTSNNITYAAFGDAMKYWDFFPAKGDDAAQWGRIPVWGFATVSRVGAHVVDLKIGERVYGYFPMSSYLVVTPGRFNPQGFSDIVDHRKALHPIYNQYRRCAADLGYNATREAQQMLVQPLFLTSFLIEDFLSDNQHFDAEQIIVTSASSKTSYSLAYMIKQRNLAMVGEGATSGLVNNKKQKIVGLTSANNAIFVNAMGVYDQVVTYEAFNQIQANKKAVIVDMAGNGQLRNALHQHLGDSLTYSCAVGGTHWDQLAQPKTASETPGPKPTLFFAPAQAKKRATEWGPEQLQRRIGKAWLSFQPTLDDWMHVMLFDGAVALAGVYEDLLAGRSKADQGYVVSL